MGGSFQTLGHIEKQLENELSTAERVIASQARNVQAGNVRDVVSAVGDDAASQIGGTALGYVQEKLARSAFAPPGPKPVNFYLAMQTNVNVFFTGWEETVQRVQKEMLIGKIPVSRAERWYRFFLNLPSIHTFPAKQDFEGDFKKEASLCLWIAWGAERDFPYWDKAWMAADQGLLNGPATVTLGFYDDAKATRHELSRESYEDILRWDSLKSVISEINPDLVIYASRFAAGLRMDADETLSDKVADAFKAGTRARGNAYLAQAGSTKRLATEPVKPISVKYSGMHIDVRLLKDLGLYSKFKSAQAMSHYFQVPQKPMRPEAARKILGSIF